MELFALARSPHPTLSPYEGQGVSGPLTGLDDFVTHSHTSTHYDPLMIPKLRLGLLSKLYVEAPFATDPPNSISKKNRSKRKA